MGGLKADSNAEATTLQEPAAPLAAGAQLTLKSDVAVMPVATPTLKAHEYFAFAATPKEAVTLALLRAPWWMLTLVALLASGLGLYLSRGKYFLSDVDTAVAWANKLHTTPWSQFFTDKHDGDSFVLHLYYLGAVGWVIAHLGAAGASAANILVRVPPVLAVVGLGLSYARYLAGLLAPLPGQVPSPEAQRALLGIGTPLLGALLWALNPALLYNAAVFGQTDALCVMLGTLALIYATRAAPRRSACFVALALAVQGHAVVSLLGVLFILWSKKASFSRRDVAVSVMMGASLLALAAVPFWQGHWAALPAYYLQQFATMRYASVNAFNFYGGLGWNWRELSAYGWWRFDTLTVTLLWWTSASVATVVFAQKWCHYLWRALTSEQALLLATNLGLIAYMLAPAMHERSLFAVFPLLVMVSGRSRRLFAVALILSIVLVIDQMAVLDTYFGFKLAIGRLGPLPLASGCIKFACLVTLLRTMHELPAAPVYGPQQLPDAAASQRAGEHTALSAEMLFDRLSVARFRRMDLIIMAVIGALALGQALPRLGHEAVPRTDASGEFSLSLDFAPGTTLKGIGVFVTGGTPDVDVECHTKPGMQFGSVGFAGSEPKLNGYHQWVMRRFQNPCTGSLKLVVKSPAPSSVGEVYLLDQNLHAIQPLRACDVAGTRCVAAATHPLFDEPQTLKTAFDVRGNVYFDEVYFVRAAHELLAGKPIYETTHPPLGKDIIAWTVGYFGDTPWAWRLPAAVAGALTCVLLYAFALLLFARRSVAVGTAALALLDLSRVAMERIGTVDTILNLLILCSYAGVFQLCALRVAARQGGERGSPRFVGFLSGAAWGMAVATKWIAIYAAPGFAALLLFDYLAERQIYQTRYSLVPREAQRLWQYGRRYALSLILGFAVLPVSIYLLSYVPMYQSGSMQGSWMEVINHNLNILRYHVNLVGEHPYASRFYEWTWVHRPLLMFEGSDPATSLRSVIVELSNPLLSWSIPVALFAVLYNRRLRRELPAMFLVLAFGAQTFPWLLVTRSTFSYHYLTPSCLALPLIAWLAVKIWDSGSQRARFGVAVYGVAVVALTVILWPVVFGSEVTNQAVERLLWFDTWRF